MIEPFYLMAVFSILYLLLLGVIWVGGMLAAWRDRRGR